MRKGWVGEGVGLGEGVGFDCIHGDIITRNAHRSESFAVQSLRLNRVNVVNPVWREDPDPWPDTRHRTCANESASPFHLALSCRVVWMFV